MTDRIPTPPLFLSIAATERDTGLTKDTLRVWERRYGFPDPARDAAGERRYPLEQVEKLRLLKRLLDAGHRPGKIVPMPLPELGRLARSTLDQPAARSAAAPDLAPYLQLLRGHDMAELRRRLGQALVRMGLNRFATELVAPLNTQVDEGWMRGQLEIFEAHLYTEAMTVVLRDAIRAVPASARADRPRVLLGTVPGEPQALGLLIAEALLALDGAHCVSLGVQTPVWDIVLAAGAQRADIVALVFGNRLPAEQVHDALDALREQLPAGTELWAGGSAPLLARRPAAAGVVHLPAFARVHEELQRWREGVHPAPAPARNLAPVESPDR